MESPVTSKWQLCCSLCLRTFCYYWTEVSGDRQEVIVMKRQRLHIVKRAGWNQTQPGELSVCPCCSLFTTSLGRMLHYATTLPAVLKCGYLTKHPHVTGRAWEMLLVKITQSFAPIFLLQTHQLQELTVHLLPTAWQDNQCYSRHLSVFLMLWLIGV